MSHYALHISHYALSTFVGRGRYALSIFVGRKAVDELMEARKAVVQVQPGKGETRWTLYVTCVVWPCRSRA